MKITDIEPTKGHVLVELPPATTEVGGLILAGDQANNAPVRGTVIRISQDGSLFKVGEELFFRKYAIDELKFNESDMSKVEVYIIDEKEVLGVVRPIKEEETKPDESVVRAETKEADRKLKDSLT